MIDINLLRNDPQYVANALLKKDCTIDMEMLLQLDKNKRKIIMDLEKMKFDRNRCSAEVCQLKREGESFEEMIENNKKLGEEIKAKEAELEIVTDKFNKIFYALPNLPDDDLVAGGKENNEPVYTFGTKPHFHFSPKSHVDLCTSLNLIDYERAAKLSGNGFWIYTGLGAQLEWALLNFFISEHIKDGYQFILPPEMLNKECGFGSGQFPKFADEVYYVNKFNGEKTEQFLLPTAESALVNLFAGEIIAEKDLPKKLFAYSPCFRLEAGSYRAGERGMIRGHQFNKVEMVAYTKPKDANKMFDEMVNKAKRLMEKLGLHYQVSKLAAGDVSDTMTRTYDIEVWIPSMSIYKEVSSVSNGRAYQARRSNTRYRDSEGKTDFVNILNGSGLATSRILPAIVEQFQTPDGGVIIPEVLRPFMNGLEEIKPINK